jgi:hypothetical protein
MYLIIICLFNCFFIISFSLFKLTGITQSMVDNQPVLEETLDVSFFLFNFYEFIK